jgi:hypothetical protein
MVQLFPHVPDQSLEEVFCLGAPTHLWPLWCSASQQEGAVARHTPHHFPFMQQHWSQHQNCTNKKQFFKLIACECARRLWHPDKRTNIATLQTYALIFFEVLTVAVEHHLVLCYFENIEHNSYMTLAKLLHEKHVSHASRRWRMPHAAQTCKRLEITINHLIFCSIFYHVCSA